MDHSVFYRLVWVAILTTGLLPWCLLSTIRISSIGHPLTVVYSSGLLVKNYNCLGTIAVVDQEEEGAELWGTETHNPYGAKERKRGRNSSGNWAGMHSPQKKSTSEVFRFESEARQNIILEKPEMWSAEGRMDEKKCRYEKKTLCTCNAKWKKPAMLYWHRAKA